MESNDLKYALEAVLFASERPLTPEILRNAFEEKVSAGDITQALNDLRAEYENSPRGFKLFEIAGGWQLVSDERFSTYLKRFYQDRSERRLSQAGLEILSVIAYRQPVTKADIEFIRGVNVDGPLKTLLEKSMVKIVGKKDIPGRPFMYGTTTEFLEHFGLKSLEELPQLAQFTVKDIEEHLLPPDMRTPEEVVAGSIEEAPVADASVEAPIESGEQQPVGCDNTPDENSQESAS